MPNCCLDVLVNVARCVCILAKAEEGSQVAEEAKAEKWQESQFVFAFFPPFYLCVRVEKTDGVARRPLSWLLGGGRQMAISQTMVKTFWVVKT